MKMIRSSSVLLLALYLSACSSNSSSPSGVKLDSLSDVSSALDALDNLVFDEEGANARINARALSQGDAVGDFSYLGCQYIQDRQYMFNSVNRVRGALCKVGSAEGSGTGFSVGDESYNYFEISAIADEHTQGTINIRLGKFANADGTKCVKFDICQLGSQTQSYQVCQTNGGLTASVQDKYSEEREGQTVSGSSSMDLNGTSDETGDIVGVSLTTSFTGDFGEGSAEFGADKAAEKNTFSGFFDFSNVLDTGTYANQTAVCLAAGGGVGSGKLHSAATFPSYNYDGLWWCPPVPGTDPWVATESTEGGTCPQEFDYSRSFKIISGSPPTASIIDDADSPWADGVADCTLPTEAKPVADFAVAWDCTAPNGFTQIDGSALDFTACDSLEEVQPGDCDAERKEQ